ncbi:MAG: sodium:calcium antiporter [Acidobacteria bacterium]|nr:sodium:calcium antiporter [Acidobacteriota bacterium]
MDHLIKPEWFLPLHQGWLLLLTIASIGALIKGADWLVEGASGLAYRLGLPKVIVGATIVSLGTTSPECAVSVMAAWSGNAGLALGNAVGSIIADTALIFGLGCVLAQLPADRFVLNRQGWLQFGSAGLLAGICFASWWFHGDEAQLSRWSGMTLLGLLACYMVLSVRWARAHPRGEPFIVPEEIEGAAPVVPPPPEQARHKSCGGLIASCLAGLAVVVFSSHVLVCAVAALAIRWGVPQVVIAATLVAVGTSMPELVVGLTSIFKGAPELLVGNVIGADVLNVLFVVGASATARPLPIVERGAAVPEIFLWLHLPAMLVVLGIFRLYIFRAVREGHFRRWMGIPLLFLYGTYAIAQYALSRG